MANEITPQTLHDAVYGKGPLAALWDDKPHRLVIEAAEEIAGVQYELAMQVEEMARLRTAYLRRIGYRKGAV